MKASDVREYLHFYIDDMPKKDLKKDYFRLDVYTEGDNVDIEYSDLDGDNE